MEVYSALAVATQSINLEDLLPATFTAPDLTHAQFLALCEKFPEATVECSEEGEIIVMPPADRNSSARVALVVHRLLTWVEKMGRGKVCGPDGGFRLPGGARRSPDAAWFVGDPPNERFPVFAPQFVIEVRSPDDRVARLRDKVARLRDKMERYIAAGVQLAWLIDPIERSVTIYRVSGEPEVLVNPASVAGEGPVEGFELDLAGILIVDSH